MSVFAIILATLAAFGLVEKDKAKKVMFTLKGKIPNKDFDEMVKQIKDVVDIEPQKKGKK